MAWNILKSRTQNNGVRYQSGLLWKMDEPKLPNNFFVVQRRFSTSNQNLPKTKAWLVSKRAWSTRMSNSNTLVSWREKVIDEGPPGRTWYNPHHPVFNPNKPGKCRVVFDLSAKCHGFCLNDVLLKGRIYLPVPSAFYCGFGNCHVEITWHTRETYPALISFLENKQGRMYEYIRPYFVWMSR